jgi:hypothetical protein
MDYSMVQKIKVKEYVLNDGIGAQIWRKLYAMSYAKYHNLVFEDTPIIDFLIHESDKINNDEEKKELISKLVSVIHNPWKDIDFSNDQDYILCDKIGAAIPESQGMITPSEFTVSATDFNSITDCDNSIVIHIRRGNVIKENPRWISDEVYINILKNINLVVEKLEMINPKIIILTDAPDKEKYYTPINNTQKDMWQQPYLNPNESGAYITTSLDFDSIRSAYPDIEIVNKMNTYESFILMLRAKVLFVSRSAFSQSAGVLSKNNVFEMFGSINGFKNTCGMVKEDGSIIFYK